MQAALMMLWQEQTSKIIVFASECTDSFVDEVLGGQK